MTDANLNNKRILVSGSGTGIGYEVALEFARRGCDVVVHYSHHAEGALQAVEQIESLGQRATAIEADFADVPAVQRLGERAVAFLGGLDVLVNNAGITWQREFGEVSADDFDRIYHVNIRGPYFLTQACLPALLESRGAVVNISSIHGLLSRPNFSVYAGTKGAIVSWTRQLAIELAPKGVRVNCIAPGAIYVDSYKQAYPDFQPDNAGSKVPCGFIGQPPDVAKLAVFLASDDARFIVGQTIVADGGTTSWFSLSEGYRA